MENYLSFRVKRSREQGGDYEVGDSSVPRPSQKQKMANSVNLNMDQLKEALSQVIDSKGLATKDDIRMLNGKIEQISQETSLLKQQVKRLEDRCGVYESQIDFLFNKYKKNNLIFKNLDVKESSLTNYGFLIKKFCDELLGLKDIQILSKGNV